MGRPVDGYRRKRHARGITATRAIAGLTAVLAIATATPATSPRPNLVTIAGYAGDVMEPFCAPDGTLFYNTRNGAGDRPELRYATRSPGGRLVDRGVVAGTESQFLNGVPSIDRARELFFISPRSYDTTLATIYTARFDAHHAYAVRTVAGLAAPRRGIVRFDADVSPDGRRLLISEGTFDATGGPHSAILEEARRSGDGFAIDPTSPRIFAAINADGLAYAGTMSEDRRVLYFTRATPGVGPGIWISRRKSPDEPFEAPKKIDGIEAFVEAPTICKRRLLFHARVAGNHFALFSIPLPGEAKTASSILP